jgi:hypothetical protein
VGLCICRVRWAHFWTATIRTADPTGCILPRWVRPAKSCWMPRRRPKQRSLRLENTQLPGVPKKGFIALQHHGDPIQCQLPEWRVARPSVLRGRASDVPNCVRQVVSRFGTPSEYRGTGRPAVSTYAPHASHGMWASFVSSQRRQLS